ncbi:MAG: glycosyltransferase [Actinomycetota bacterium]|nr:glycosyltransferase [Actinomycetota bacterium]
MRICFVVPRYGSEIIGGAEYAARMLAEALVRNFDTTVEIFTTTAKDLETWDNHYDAGLSVENGVRVNRFQVTSGRRRDFAKVSSKLLPSAASQSYEVGKEIIFSQGPVSNDLIDALAAYDGDVVAFYPYLYHCTTEGIAIVTNALRVMHPAAHNEAIFELDYIGRSIQQADALIYQTKAEQVMVEERHGVGSTPNLLLGAPYRLSQPGKFDFSQFKKGRYLLYIGRVDAQKGVSLLAEYFHIYKERHPSDLKLVIAGPVITKPTLGDDIVLLGTVDETTKSTLLKNSLALVQPSLHEAFSIVLMESWESKRPVIVHKDCAATFEHVTTSGGGIAFYDFLSFEATIEMLAGDEGVGDFLGEAGYDYAHNLYFEDNIASRYFEFLKLLLGETVS